jgi:hypothetical protein
VSTNLAYARPQTRPIRESAPARHFEIVTTRAQRKARPKVAYAVVTVASLFAIFAAQLLLSIVVSEGAYQINALQSQQKELMRTEQALSENLDLLASTQNLAANAAHLGMVPSASPLFLDLSSGALSHAPGSIDRVGCGGACNLIANDLLTGVPLANTTAPSAHAASTQAAVSKPAIVVDSLPAPVTH